MRRGESMNIDEVWLHLTNTGTDWPNGNYRSTIASFTPNEESSQEKKEIELKIQLSSAEVRHLDDSELWTKFWRGELAEAPNFVVIVETNTRIYFGKHPTCQSVIAHVFISKLTIPLHCQFTFSSKDLWCRNILLKYCCILITCGSHGWLAVWNGTIWNHLFSIAPTLLWRKPLQATISSQSPVPQNLGGNILSECCRENPRSRSGILPWRIFFFSRKYLSWVHCHEIFLLF